MYNFVYILINYKSLFVLYKFYFTLFNLFIFIIILNRQKLNQQALKKIDLNKTLIK